MAGQSILRKAAAYFDHRIARVLYSYRGEQELLRFAFTDPLIHGEQVHAPIASLDGIYEANRSMMLPVEQFFDAYEHLEVIDARLLGLDQGSTRVLKVTYGIAGNRYDAYAYAVDASESGDSAALVFPGSEFNQSSAIYKNNPSNYHFGIMEALGSAFQKFILIKPNEDCLAFHNGKSKLNQDFFINWLLDHGASYSAYYIANSLAVTAYLQSRYDRVVLAGLSQGGEVALLNSLQSRPDVAIVASGFSVVGARVKWAGHNQIIIPGLQQRLSAGHIRSRIQKLPTNFLFMYGKKEQGTYKIEAEERLTCKYLSDLENVECRIHEYGHIFPVDIICEFLSTHFYSTG